MQLTSLQCAVERSKRSPPSAPSRRRRYKRPFDLAVLGLVCFAFWPAWLVLVTAVAAAVRWHDGGPALYRQRRLGRDGQVFDMLKFRTMPVNAERRTGPVWASGRDRRATPVGRVLRRLHLDELPQVVNVARGEMSLVGPRPERPGMAARIEREHPGFATRLSVPPGIAGLAQARCRFPAAPRDKLRYDRVYIAAMGPWLDLKLLAACVWRTLLGRPPGAARGNPVRSPARRPGRLRPGQRRRALARRGSPSPRFREPGR